MTRTRQRGATSDAVWRLIKAKEYEKARAVLLRRLDNEPKNHWLLTRIGTTHYEEGDYENALGYHEKALGLAPRCPLVLWDYAATLNMLGRGKEAIRVWRRLVRRGPLSIARGECGEGIGRARSLVNDCLYCIGIAYAGMGRFDLGTRYLRAHITNRGPNCGSIYNLREVKRELSEIDGKRTGGARHRKVR